MNLAEFTQTEARYVTIAVVLALLIIGLLVGVRLILRHRVSRVRFGVFIERDDSDDDPPD